MRVKCLRSERAALAVFLLCARRADAVRVPRLRSVGEVLAQCLRSVRPQ